MFLRISLAIFIFLFSLNAQTTVTASLRGRVLDPTGAAIPAAFLALLNIRSGIERSAMSGLEGEYSFPRLEPGSYSLKVSRQGFKTTSWPSFDLGLNEQPVANVTLAVGELAEQITITSELPLVQAQSAEVSASITSNRLSTLPLNGKDYQKLVLLSAGVGNTFGSAVNNPAVNGIRPGANTFTLDGTNFSDERFTQGASGGGGAAGAADAAPNAVPSEAILEYRVITANSDASYGRGSGAQINVLTKGGTNQLHGSAYEYLRNNVFDARDFFNYGPFFDASGRAKTPPLRQNLYGGTVGGAIRKNRDFYFASFEGFRQRQERTASAVVPSAALLRFIPGDLGKFYRAFYLDRNVTPATGIPGGSFRPLSVAERATIVAAGYPSALFDGNPANDEAGSSLLSTTQTLDTRQNSVLGRTDHRVSQKLSISTRYSFSQPDRLSGASTGLAFDATRSQQRIQSGMAQAVYTASPNRLLELRASLQRYKQNNALDGGLDPKLAAAGVSPQYGLVAGPVATVLPFILLWPTTFFEGTTVPQIAVTHTWTKSRVTWRTGADIRWINVNTRLAFREAPTYQFFGYVGPNGIFGTGPTATETVASSVAATIFGTNGGPTTSMRGLRSHTQEYFAQADWKVRNNITVNAGLRYSYYGVYSEVNRAMSNLYANPGEKIDAGLSPLSQGRTVNQIGVVGKDAPFYSSDYTNFQPRLGIAWDLAGKGATILRAGYGLFADRIFQGQFSNNLTNSPYAASSTVTNVPFRLGGALPVNAAIPTVWAVDPSIRNPLTHHFNAAIERRIGAQTTLTAAYVGTRGRNLINGIEPNAGPNLPQALRPDVRFSDQRIINNQSYSNYNSLQILAKRRLASGLDFTATFTAARSRDNRSQSAVTAGERQPSLINTGADPSLPGIQGGGSLFVNRPLEADYGYSDFHVGRRLAVSHSYKLPFGKGILGAWTLSGIAILQSGNPYTIFSGTDYNEDGDPTTDRPAFLGGQGGSLASGSSNKTQQLLPSADAQKLLGVPTNLKDPFAPISRNTQFSSSLLNYDTALSKLFAVGERLKILFEVNAFNVFNRAHFAAPIATLNNPRFGQVTGTRAGTNPRQLQLGLKIAF